jgi:hypothetical protein
MPDEQGSQTAEVEETTLHAYGDGRDDEVDPGSRGVTGDQGTGDEASYQEGGHEADTEFGEVPAPTGQQDAPGADTGSGAGPADPGGNDIDADADADAGEDPESPARADAARAPRGAPVP